MIENINIHCMKAKFCVLVCFFMYIGYVCVDEKIVLILIQAFGGISFHPFMILIES